MVTTRALKKAPPKKPAKARVHKEHKEEVREVKARPLAAAPFVAAVGRRKRATARVRLFAGSGTFTINGKEFTQYFRHKDQQDIVRAPLIMTGQDALVDGTVLVNGGGFQGQAEAVRHGISRALLLIDPLFRKTIKKASFLKRDPREKERKKYGLKKARRAPQWQKR